MRARGRLAHGLGIVALVLSVACSSSTETDGAGAGSETENAALAGPSRDWPILKIDEAEEIYALSDVHGGYVQLGRLLEKNGLISGFDSDPKRPKVARWTGKNVILVVAGDVIDKGAENVASIDFLRSLETQAAKEGGRVVVTMGNHEAEFLADPKNKKAMLSSSSGRGLSTELLALKIDPEEVAAGKDADGRGAWLRSLPFGVRIKKWFFSHGGNTDGDSIEKLDSRLRSAVESKDGFGHKDIVGDDSILEAQEWYGGGKRQKAHDCAKALGVKHLVFGHDPGALEDRGRIKADADGLLVKVNVNMGLAEESKALVGGALLHVTIVKDAPDHAESLDADGTETPLF